MDVTRHKMITTCFRHNNWKQALRTHCGISTRVTALHDFPFSFFTTAQNQNDLTVKSNLHKDDHIFFVLYHRVQKANRAKRYENKYCDNVHDKFIKGTWSSEKCFGKTMRWKNILANVQVLVVVVNSGV